jgi:hypothetical protein
MVGVLQVVSKHKQPEKTLESLGSVVRGEDLARSEVESCRTLREEVGRFRK